MDIAEDIDVEGESSLQRLKRAKQCQPLDSKEAIINIMSDTHCKEYPVFRDGEDKDGITTVTVGKIWLQMKVNLINKMTVLTGLFDLMEKTWTLWMKKPTENDPIAVLPLIFKEPSK